jgi:hypothetical protein
MLTMLLKARSFEELPHLFSLHTMCGQMLTHQTFGSTKTSRCLHQAQIG